MEGSTTPFLRLTAIANAITLVELLVPINSHSIDGRVDREVVVICSDPMRHESRRLTDLHQEPYPSVNGRRTFLHTMLVDHMEQIAQFLAGAGARYCSHAWFAVGICGGPGGVAGLGTWVLVR